MQSPAYVEQFYLREATLSFGTARRRHFWAGFWRLLTGRSNRLVSLDDVATGVTEYVKRDLGVVSVDTRDIVGTVNRSRDFDRSFMPRREHEMHRWMRVDIAHQKGLTLPPLDLVKVGGDYFVVDGHHRLSVFRLHGQQYVDARVVEYLPNRAPARMERKLRTDGLPAQPYNRRTGEIPAFSGG